MITRKLGSNKGQTRLWLEGAVLIERGFLPGTRYNLLPDISGGYMLAIDPLGTRKVSGSGLRPIIDICSTAKLERFGKAGDLVEVLPVSVQGVLIITKVERQSA